MYLIVGLFKKIFVGSQETTGTNSEQIDRKSSNKEKIERISSVSSKEYLGQSDNEIIQFTEHNEFSTSKKNNKDGLINKENQYISEDKNANEYSILENEENINLIKGNYPYNYNGKIPVTFWSYNCCSFNSAFYFLFAPENKSLLREIFENNEETLIKKIESNLNEKVKSNSSHEEIDYWKERSEAWGGLTLNEKKQEMARFKKAVKSLYHFITNKIDDHEIDEKFCIFGKGEDLEYEGKKNISGKNVYEFKNHGDKFHDAETSMFGKNSEGGDFRKKQVLFHHPTY